MIPQHATSERDREIAQALDLMIAEARTAAARDAAESIARSGHRHGSDTGACCLIWHESGTWGCFRLQITEARIRG